MAQELHLSLFADARDLGKLGREIAFLAAFAVKLDGGFVRLFADLQDQAETRANCGRTGSAGPRGRRSEGARSRCAVSAV